MVSLLRSDRAGDEHEGEVRVGVLQLAGHRQGQVVHEGGVLGLGLAAGAGAQAVEAGVEVRQRRQVGQRHVGYLQGVQTRILLGRGCTADGNDMGHILCLQAFGEDALADHAGGAEEEDFHGWGAVDQCGGRRDADAG